MSVTACLLGFGERGALGSAPQRALFMNWMRLAFSICLGMQQPPLSPNFSLVGRITA
jgi:hypothetical protein